MSFDCLYFIHHLPITRGNPDNLDCPRPNGITDGTYLITVTSWLVTRFTQWLLITSKDSIFATHAHCFISIYKVKIIIRALAVHRSQEARGSIPVGGNDRVATLDIDQDWVHPDVEEIFDCRVQVLNNTCCFLIWTFQSSVKLVCLCLYFLTYTSRIVS